VRRAIKGIAILHDGNELQSSTTLMRAGPYTVVLASTVSGVDVEFYSTYIGHPAVDTRGVHLELSRRGGARVSIREDAHEALPVTYAHERLMIDHVARLRELVAAGGGGHTTVELDDTALASSQPEQHH
jgi:hypothetical protein